MARNDGIDRTSVRNLAVSDKAVGNTQQHNEREKDSYRNPDIIPQRTAWNVHFKKPTASYTDLFAQLETAGTISTRGLKPDATHYQMADPIPRPAERGAALSGRYAPRPGACAQFF